MKNFESQTAKILLNQIQDLNTKQDTSMSKELSDRYLTQVSSLYDLARELFNISTRGWYYIEKELTVISEA
jgi:hypothetical protein